MPQHKNSQRDFILQKILGRFKDKRVLLLGIGGGGDVVSTLPIYFDLERLGATVFLGGLSWKRKVHDPIACPRKISEFVNISPINELLGFSNKDTRVGQGIQHVESQLSTALSGKEILVADITPGSGAVTRAIKNFVELYKIDQIIAIDAGGDALCEGSEESIRSPICDQIMLAALSKIPGSLLGVHSFGTDGELSFSDFIPRFSSLSKVGAYLGALDIAHEDQTRLKSLLIELKTESSKYSVQVAEKLNALVRDKFRELLNQSQPDLRAFSSSFEKLELRGGLRVGELGPLSAFTLFFDLNSVFNSSKFAEWIWPEMDIHEIHRILSQLGIKTEFDQR